MTDADSGFLNVRMKKQASWGKQLFSKKKSSGKLVDFAAPGASGGTGRRGRTGRRNISMRMPDRQILAMGMVDRFGSTRSITIYIALSTQH